MSAQIRARTEGERAPWETSGARCVTLLLGEQLVLWASGSSLDTWYTRVGSPLGIWRQWADDVTGQPIAGGHFFAEENAAETLSAMKQFFSR